MRARRRDEGGELGDELEPVEEQRFGAATPTVLLDQLLEMGVRAEQQALAGWGLK